MPRIIFKNIHKNDLPVLSERLSIECANIIDCPVDWLTFEYIENMVYCENRDITQEIVFVEIHWFSRGQDMQDLLADYIYTSLATYYDHKKEITLIFNTLKKHDYYENGTHY